MLLSVSELSGMLFQFNGIHNQFYHNLLDNVSKADKKAYHSMSFQEHIIWFSRFPYNSSLHYLPGFWLDIELYIVLCNVNYSFLILFP
jgi:hypothetical protein